MTRSAMPEALPGEIIVLNSASDPEASAKFKEWRRANKLLGHYLNLNPEQGWFLHRARCPSVPPGGNTAGNEKRCAARRELIDRHAAEQGIKPQRCQQCN